MLECFLQVVTDRGRMSPRVDSTSNVSGLIRKSGGQGMVNTAFAYLNFLLSGR